MMRMEIKLSPKIPKKYLCKFCDYNTCNSKDYKKHIFTAKHKNNSIGNKMEKMEIKNPQYICECGNYYN